jgi:hypothetical protein
MMDNPYVEARLEMDGPVHRGKIHAAAITDRTMPRLVMGANKLRLIDCDYQDWIVDDALVQIGDRSLMAEVIRWRALQKRFKTIQESIRKMED